MERQEIIAKLTHVVSNVFQIENLVLNEDMSAETVEQWTSLSFMTLLTEVENQFGFKFKMMEVLKLKTMGDIIAAIERHKA